jgi:hypothetical protein
LEDNSKHLHVDIHKNDVSKLVRGWQWEIHIWYVTNIKKKELNDQKNCEGVNLVILSSWGLLGRMKEFSHGIKKLFHFNHYDNQKMLVQ